MHSVQSHFSDFFSSKSDSPHSSQHFLLALPDCTPRRGRSSGRLAAPRWNEGLPESGLPLTALWLWGTEGLLTEFAIRVAPPWVGVNKICWLLREEGPWESSCWLYWGRHQTMPDSRVAMKADNASLTAVLCIWAFGIFMEILIFTNITSKLNFLFRCDYSVFEPECLY